MQKLRVDNFTISLDGFGAGVDQDIKNPLGIGGLDLHRWLFSTDVFQQVTAGKHGEIGVDNDFATRGFENVGAWIMGRNMFGPIRGSWPDDSWKGWWGEYPPFHGPVYVLTHHARKSITMKGGTVFHFVTDGIDAALQLAKQSANEKDVRLGGGVSTIQQYLKAKLIDEVHLTLSPIILGAGERLFADINLLELGYYCTKNTCSDKVMHLLIAKAK